MAHPILNIDQIDEFRMLGHKGPALGATRPDERYEGRLGAVGSKIGAQKLGYNLTILPPGKRGFPRHNHRVNEEMFFIIEGAGEVQIGEKIYPVRRGDVIACPPGGPETAHQIRNTSADTELKFLAISTRLSPEIAEYPDSGKFGLYAELPQSAEGKPQLMRFLAREGTSLDYWDGE